MGIEHNIVANGMTIIWMNQHNMAMLHFPSDFLHLTHAQGEVDAAQPRNSAAPRVWELVESWNLQRFMIFYGCKVEETV